MKDKKQPYWKRAGFKSSYDYQLYRIQQRGFNSISEYNNHRLKNQGYERGLYDYMLDKNLVTLTDEWRIKEYNEDRCATAVEIPDIPGYYITPMGEIWKYRELTAGGKWHVIKQQSHKSGYKAFQPYIDGKRHVKYVHRALCSAFYGARDASHEAHHINGDRHDNTLDNVVWMTRDSHRRMKRGKYNK